MDSIEKTPISARKVLSVGSLSDNAIKFLRRLSSDGWATCRSNPPAASIQGLVDGGYCKLSKALSGPLALATGEVMVGLSDAGRAVLASIDDELKRDIARRNP